MIDWSEYGPGEHRVACPSCGRNPRDRTLGVTIDHKGGVAHCFRCGWIASDNGKQSHRVQPTRQARPVTHQKRETLSEWGVDHWNACSPISGVARAYLEARSCVIPPEDGHLRWNAREKHPTSSYVGPCLIALVTDALTGKPMTLHRTWINGDGTKADVDPPRMLLGGHRKAGGVVRLWPGVTAGLGIAEGIETALSLAHAHQPTWAAIDAGNLATFAVLPGIESLLIAADHDPAGVAASKECARRWRSAGRRVRVVIPDVPGQDWNDVARAA